eukprot:gnl/MRDRNA2_/MRDRNA2_68587_c0_seq4.p1 gnl/MRDRNA2_/MRDRNA2_68587_c0~~gnl/MRDRNA2_/MRDRNA2_68587_c0_seq4.p1  ORF type:complete len:365 (-),score=76.32 gnl/MRDRNA2_/MRDRNA2_68587_c0_seq4:1-1095(-)
MPNSIAAAQEALLPVRITAVQRDVEQGTDDGIKEDVVDFADLKTEDLEEDCYGLAIAALVRDCQRLERDHNNYATIRSARLAVSMLLLFINIFLQAFFMFQIKRFVTAKAVHDIREAYDAYERKMYGDHIELTVNGKARGIGGENGDYFGGTAAFSTLGDDIKALACKIPFSQPSFFYCILFVWSATVIGEIKKCWLIFWRLILNTEHADTMAHATEENDDGEEVIRRLTWVIKFSICVTILVPRTIIACVLLWLGCRWLTATNDFADLLLNAVALEFILVLKELLYNTFVPNRNKHDLCKTKISIEHESGPPSAVDFLGAFVWMIVTWVWVMFYAFYFQAVLPGYRFDVHNMCEGWISQRYAV